MAFLGVGGAGRLRAERISESVFARVAVYDGHRWFRSRN
jgi:hypothetical protein